MLNQWLMIGSHYIVFMFSSVSIQFFMNGFLNGINRQLSSCQIDNADDNMPYTWANKRNNDVLEELNDSCFQQDDVNLLDHHFEITPS